MNERIYRSRDDRMIGGVCGGLAERFDLDPSLVRVGWALLTIVSGGVFLIIYAVMLFVVPEGPEGVVPRPVQPPGPDAVPGWQPPSEADGPIIPSGTAAAGSGSIAADASGGPSSSAASGDTSPTTAETTTWGAASQPPAAARPAAKRDGSAGLIVGLLLILGGAFLLFQQFVPSFDLDQFWPVAVIGIGAVLLLLSVRPGRDAK